MENFLLIFHLSFEISDNPIAYDVNFMSWDPEQEFYLLPPNLFSLILSSSFFNICLLFSSSWFSFQKLILCATFDACRRVYTKVYNQYYKNVYTYTYIYHSRKLNPHSFSRVKGEKSCFRSTII